MKYIILSILATPIMLLAQRILWAYVVKSTNGNRYYITLALFIPYIVSSVTGLVLAFKGRSHLNKKWIFWLSFWINLIIGIISTNVVILHSL